MNHQQIVERLHQAINFYLIISGMLAALLLMGAGVVITFCIFGNISPDGNFWLKIITNGGQAISLGTLVFYYFQARKQAIEDGDAKRATTCLLAIIALLMADTLTLLTYNTESAFGMTMMQAFEYFNINPHVLIVARTGAIIIAVILDADMLSHVVRKITPAHATTSKSPLIVPDSSLSSKGPMNGSSTPGSLFGKR